MKYSIYKLLKVFGILIVVLSVSLALYYECSRDDSLLTPSKAKTKAINPEDSSCFKISDIEDATTEAVLKDLDSVIEGVAKSYINDANSGNENNNDILHLVDRRYCETSVEPLDAQIVGDPIKDDLEPFYHSLGTFANSVDQTQKFPSLAYTKKLTKISSATNRYNWGAGMTVANQTTVGIPFVAEDGLKITMEFSFNYTSTQTNTKMEEETYMFPSQIIEVPPKHTYQLVAFINQQHMESNVTLEFPINFSGVLIANTPDNMAPVYFNKEQLLHYVNKYDPDAMEGYPAFVINNKGKLVYRNKGTIEATYGLNYGAELRDITNPKAPVLLKTINLK